MKLANRNHFLKFYSQKSETETINTNSFFENIEMMRNRFCFCYKCKFCYLKTENFQIFSKHTEKKHGFFICECCFDEKYSANDYVCYKRNEIFDHLLGEDHLKNAFKSIYYPSCNFCNITLQDKNTYLDHINEEQSNYKLCEEDPNTEPETYNQKVNNTKKIDFSKLIKHFRDMASETTNVTALIPITPYLVDKVKEYQLSEKYRDINNGLQSLSMNNNKEASIEGYKCCENHRHKNIELQSFSMNNNNEEDFIEDYKCCENYRHKNIGVQSFNMKKNKKNKRGKFDLFDLFDERSNMNVKPCVPKKSKYYKEIYKLNLEIYILREHPKDVVTIKNLLNVYHSVEGKFQDLINGLYKIIDEKNTFYILVRILKTLDDGSRDEMLQFIEKYLVNIKDIIEQQERRMEMLLILNE